ncbi:MAG TPA: hypothetical protein VK977_09820 [Actinomycetota bacterium]|nr:hypothetical protein [Actinomycetota bacterium]
MPGDDRPAFYALSPGGWRDYVTLLHPPYTAWHLSYVAIGAGLAPRFSMARLVASLVAFFLAVGIGAHALDEYAGRPLQTRIPNRTLQVLAGAGLIGAVFLGLLGAVMVSLVLVLFVAFGAFIVLAYNLESFGGRFHSDAWFAVSWGAFPCATGFFAQGAAFRWPVVPAALACLVLSAAQRRLSTPVRRLRRTVIALEGRMRLEDGTEVALDDSVLRQAPEAALRAMAAGMVLLALAVAGARVA